MIPRQSSSICSLVVIAQQLLLFWLRISGVAAEYDIQKILEEDVFWIENRTGHTGRCAQFAERVSLKEYSDKAMVTLSEEVVSAIGGQTVQYYTLCNNEQAHFSIGNVIQNYFTVASCAKKIGGHFVAPSALWEKYEKLNGMEFYAAFTKVVVHAKPQPSREQYDADFDKYCGPCTWMCLNWAESPYLENVPWISEELHRALDANLRSLPEFRTGTILNSESRDITTGSLTESYPLIPDVAVQYRCGDNVEVYKTEPGHGILPFPPILKRIPDNAKTIYVLTESPKRYPGHYVEKCETILHWLFDLIVEQHPKATVLVKRGGDQFADLARLTYANTTICSSSSFCIFPAVTGNGTAYVPASILFPPPTTFVRPNFHFMEDAGLIDGFPTPWELIRMRLMQHEMTYDDMEGQVIKGKDKPSVYLFKNGTRHDFTDAYQFERLGYEWAHVWVLGQGYVNDLPKTDVPLVG